jgi:RNA 2',3'-cyclic 3'-phosphodiesterase
MRTFIAIEIPSEIKSALAALQTELRRASADVSWTKPENLHLTLNFLGEVDEKRIAEVEQACVSSAAEFRPFTLSLNGAGVFPNARRPRTLWAGLSGEVENVVALRNRIEEKLALLGFKREEKRFHPHMTIGRLKSNKKARELLALVEAHRLPALSFVVTEIVLMKSELHPAGSEYTRVAKAYLYK